MKKNYIICIFAAGFLASGCRAPVESVTLPCRGDECPKCKEGCKNTQTMYYCEADGSQGELDCPGGCHKDGCYAEQEFCDDDPYCYTDNVLLICTEGKWIYTPCPYLCKDAKCTECNTTQTFCEGDKVKACVDGYWELTDCPYGCKDGECLPECTDEPPECLSENLIRMCIDNHWTTRRCEPGTCTNGECIIIPPECTDEPPVCIAPDTRKFCDNEYWNTEVCLSGICMDGYCITPQPTCQNGESKCASIVERQYCENNDWITEECEYLCENGQCIPKPPPECYTSEGFCLTDQILRICESGYWKDLTCEYKCENGECISEDENYECSINIGGGCKDINNAFKCTGKGWATYACDFGCFGAFCQDETRACDGGHECRDPQTMMICSNGHFVDVPCPAGYLCVDNGCMDANLPFQDPRAVNPVCSEDKASLQEVCDNLYGNGICIETQSDYTFYCIGDCDPYNPPPFRCENHYPYHRAFTGKCQLISNGQYGFVPHERYLCKHSCSEETGCDEIIPVGGGHYRDDCSDIPNKCNGTKVEYCFGTKTTYDCAEAYGPNWTCATDNQDVLCAEPCSAEGATTHICANIPTSHGLAGRYTTKTCKRFDDNKLYYRLTYGNVCNGICHPSGSRCIERPNCENNKVFKTCDDKYPDKCPDGTICFTDDIGYWCGEPTEDYVSTSYCAKNDTTQKTFFKQTQSCHVRNVKTNDVSLVKFDTDETCATDECDGTIGCMYLE